MTRFRMNGLPHFFWASLRWRFALIVVIATVPFIGFLIYDASQDRQREAEKIQREAEQLARLASQEHDNAVEQGRQLLITLAQQDVVLTTGVTECNAVLADLLKRFPRYTMLGVARLDGNTFCSGLPLLNPLNVADRTYFQLAWATRGFVAGSYQIGRASGKITLPLAYPVLDSSGAVQSVIFLGVDPAWIGKFAVGARLPLDAVLSVTGTDGVILARYPDLEKLVGQSLPGDPVFRAILEQKGRGTAETIGADGVRRLYAFTPLYGTLFEPLAFMSVGFSNEAAFAEIDQRLRRNLLLIGEIALLALLAAFWTSERLLIRPVQALAKATRQMAAGDLTARSGLPRQKGEVGELARAFDEMAWSLQSRQEALAWLSKRNQLILDSAGEGIVGLDPQGYITFSNLAMARMLGWDAQEIIGKPAHETWHHSRPDGTPYPKEECPVSAVLRDGAVHKGEEVFWRKDGTSIPAEYASAPIQDERGKTVGAVLVFRDITARKRAEEELRHRYQELAALYRLSHAVAGSLALKAVADEVLETALEVLGMDGGTIRYMDEATQELVLLANRGLPEEMVQEFSAQPRLPVGQGLGGIVAQTGQPLVVEDMAHDPRVAYGSSRRAGFQVYIGLPLKVQDKVVGTMSTNSRHQRSFTPADIELVTSIGEVAGMAIANARLFDQVEAKGREWEQTFNTMGEAIAILSPDFRILRANAALAQLLGTTPQALVGLRCYEVVHGLEEPMPGCPTSRCVAERRRCELVRQEPHLGNRWLYLKSEPVLGPGGEVMSVVHTVSDITEQKRAEEQVRTSLAEKEALLKEVHHRVKNNLQVISSLLNLQGEAIQDEQVRHMFLETQNRVRSMALIHDQLYRSPELAHIDLGEFVGALTANLFRSYGVSPDNVTLRINIGSVLVPVDKAVPYGLIINELVSNSLKHAFPGGRQGEISIDFSPEHGKITLSVRDNGIGLPQEVRLEMVKTLGLQLVKSLTEQCKGTVEVRGNGGTEFRFTFPV